jgi:predicted transcriptional regulator
MPKQNENQGEDLPGKKNELQNKVIELYLKCLTHEEIASEVGLDRSRVTKLVQNIAD